MIFDKIRRIVKLGAGWLFGHKGAICEVASGAVTQPRPRIPRPRITSRSLARSMAKANMKRAGIRRINRTFSANWRKWIKR